MALTFLGQEFQKSLKRFVINLLVPPEISVRDLDIYIDDLQTVGDENLVVLVIRNLETGLEMKRLPLAADCSDVQARFSRKNRVLTLTVATSDSPQHLTEESNEDHLKSSHATASLVDAVAVELPCSSVEMAALQVPEDHRRENVAMSSRRKSEEGNSSCGEDISSWTSLPGNGSGREESPDIVSHDTSSSPLDSPAHPDRSPDAVVSVGVQQAVQAKTMDLAAEQGQREDVAAEQGEAAGEESKKKKKKKSKKKKNTPGTEGELSQEEFRGACQAQAADSDGGCGTAAAMESSAMLSSTELDVEKVQEGALSGRKGLEAVAAPGEGDMTEDRAQQCAVECVTGEESGAGASAGGMEGGGVVVGPGVWNIDPQSEPGRLSGPVLNAALAKEKSEKGEDQWLVKPSNGWRIEGEAGKTLFGAFGIFDGHGGRSVATFASNNLLKTVMKHMNEMTQGQQAALAQVPHLGGASEEEMAEWRLQATLMKRLPQACLAAFRECDARAQRQFKRGGSTATLAMCCGWEVLVANCGDSCAYLDTGAEVLQVSGNHRLDSNAEERERIEAEGGELACSQVDGKPTGPLRVWPGGLNMSRTLGDAEAGERVRGEPEICQVTIPSLGARLLIGSDGLWDAVAPKSAAHQTREMNAGEAAHRLLAQAIKKDNLKDDVTILVIDFLPGPSHRTPPSLSPFRAAPTGAGEQCARVAQVWHPLRTSCQPGTPKAQALVDFVARGAQRREAVLQQEWQAEAERRAEEEVIKERQQDAFRVMLKKAQLEGAAASEIKEALQRQGGADPKAGGEDQEGEGGGSTVSGLYRELANLRLSPEEMAAAFAASEQEAREAQEEGGEAEEPADEWETVGGDKARRQEQHRGRGQWAARGRGGRAARQPQRGGRGQAGRGREAARHPQLQEGEDGGGLAGEGEVAVLQQYTLGQDDTAGMQPATCAEPTQIGRRGRGGSRGARAGGRGVRGGRHAPHDLGSSADSGTGAGGHAPAAATARHEKQRHAAQHPTLPDHYHHQELDGIRGRGRGRTGRGGRRGRGAPPLSYAVPGQGGNGEAGGMAPASSGLVGGVGAAGPGSAPSDAYVGRGGLDTRGRGRGGRVRGRGSAQAPPLLSRHAVNGGRHEQRDWGPEREVCTGTIFGRAPGGLRGGIGRGRGRGRAGSVTVAGTPQHREDPESA